MIDNGYSEEFLDWMSTLGAHPEWHKDVLENSLGRFMFQAWQAGRRSVVVEMPGLCVWTTSDVYDKESVEEAITRAGGFFK